MARKYTGDLKKQVCKLIINENVKLQEVAKKFGINPGIVYRWIDEYKTYGDEAFVGSGNLRAEDAKIKKLEKENVQLKQELEILKKAAAYFARPKQQD